MEGAESFGSADRCLHLIVELCCDRLVFAGVELLCKGTSLLREPGSVVLCCSGHGDEGDCNCCGYESRIHVIVVGWKDRSSPSEILLRSSAWFHGCAQVRAVAGQSLTTMCGKAVARYRYLAAEFLAHADVSCDFQLCRMAGDVPLREARNSLEKPELHFLCLGEHGHDGQPCGLVNHPVERQETSGNVLGLISQADTPSWLSSLRSLVKSRCCLMPMPMKKTAAIGAWIWWPSE